MRGWNVLLVTCSNNIKAPTLDGTVCITLEHAHNCDIFFNVHFCRLYHLGYIHGTKFKFVTNAGWIEHIEGIAKKPNPPKLVIKTILLILSSFIYTALRISPRIGHWTKWVNLRIIELHQMIFGFVCMQVYKSGVWWRCVYLIIACDGKDPMNL